MNASHFRFDGDDSPILSGLTRGNTWNGWACPLLDDANMEKLAAYLTDEYFKVKKVGNTWQVTDLNYEDDSTYALPTVVVDGVTYADLDGAGYCFMECNAEGEYL